MAQSFKLKHFSNPVTLKQIDKVLLLGLLEPYRGFLAARDATVISGNEVDYEKLASILMSPGDDTPPRLLESLFYVDEMACDECHDDILEKAAEYGIDLSKMDTATTADLAVAVWLKNPNVLEAIHAEGFVDKAKKYDSFFSASHGVPRRPHASSAKLQAVEQELDKCFEKRKRGHGTKVFQFQRESKTWFLIRHGDLLKRQGILVDGEPSSIFYRPEKYDVLFYDYQTGELAIHAGAEGDRIQYCKTLGKYLFGSELFFDIDRRGKYTLEPLRIDGEVALRYSDVPGIEKVTLEDLQWRYDSDQTHTESHRANNVFDALNEQSLSIPVDAQLTKATFKIKFRSSRKRPSR
jgi:hypothetical protein